MNPGHEFAVYPSLGALSMSLKADARHPWPIRHCSTAAALRAYATCLHGQGTMDARPLCGRAAALSDRST